MEEFDYGFWPPFAAVMFGVHLFFSVMHDREGVSLFERVMSGIHLAMLPVWVALFVLFVTRDIVRAVA